MFDTCFKGFAIAWFSGMLCILAVWFGWGAVVLCKEHPDSSLLVETETGKMLAWDGVWFRRIASEGYSYDPGKMSNVAFYPLYPITARYIGQATGLGIDDALVLTSNACLVGVFVLFSKYLTGRTCRMTESESDLTLMTLALFPTTFYMRMGYSESTFLLVVLLAMYGMACRWPLFAVALIVGLATSSRPMGLALIPPFLWHAWSERQSLPMFFRNCLLLLPLCVWGICSYMVFQWYVFDEPLAFVKTQIHWYERKPPVEWGEWLLVHFSLEPFWRVYDSSSSCYWGKRSPREFALFNMSFMNPIFVLSTWGIVAWGACRKRLCATETLLSIGLLGIPYFTHSYRASCMSAARYASVAFPFYIVVGYWFGHAPRNATTLIFAAMAVCLVIYTALFVQWYWFF
jgi:hypothetical protein